MGTPLKALSHVLDFGGGHWVLFELEELESVEWRYFSTAASLNDFVRVESGEPIDVPTPLLSVSKLIFGLTGDFDLGSEPIVFVSMSSIQNWCYLNRFHGSTTGLDALEHVETCSMRSSIS